MTRAAGRHIAHQSEPMDSPQAKPMDHNDYVAYLQQTRNKYGDRQRLLHDSLVAGMPAGTTVSHPERGLSLWLTLLAASKFPNSILRRVTFVAGDFIRFAFRNTVASRQLRPQLA